MIELRTQSLFVSLEWFAQSLFVSLGGFAHREKENVVWRFVFPCGGAAAKIIVKSDRRLAWNEIVMIIRFYESRLNSKDLLPFFCQIDFFSNSNGSRMKNLRPLVAIDQTAFNNWWCSIFEHKSFKRIHQLFYNIAKTIRAFTAKKCSHRERVKRLFLGLCPESVTRPIFPIHLGHNKKWIPAEIGFLRQQSEDERLPPLLRTFTPAIIIKSVSKFSQPNAIVHDAIFPPAKKGWKSQQTSTHLFIKVINHIWQTLRCCGSSAAMKVWF